MLALHSTCRYFLYREPVHINRGFYSLAAIVKDHMQLDPLTTDVFIFLNRRCTQVKLLQWQGDGFCIYHKRLEKGTFERPVFEQHHSHTMISYSELLLILQGISLGKIQYRIRYQQKVTAH
ncbi:IS66 family insertion sequence element accessory protein TnpB [uncultured Chryseobacterium sp.]|jgi:Transposase and inactivated derivatives|uniref:IS66 family insertion sequence element accessory protein TnpB n=1 Tax=uncultured Chryseobacterium sp. TaxID=259322 RepID=UPI0026250247|nr:IS66 family insertion sequence element accessory protein TnpB [uncultured Chryseobacterium sp.]